MVYKFCSRCINNQLLWICSLFLASFIFLFLNVQNVQGSGRSYEISNVEIEARIDSAGNMFVTEWDTYEFTGSFNGIIVEMDPSGSDGLGNFKAFELQDKQEFPLEVETSVSENQVEYMIYSASQDETKTFKFTYRLKNVIQVYADTAELYWKFFDTTNQSELGRVSISVELPEKIKEKDISAFGHSEASGSLTIPEPGLVHYEVSALPKESNLGVRILFPPALVPESEKVTPTPMLKQILEEEQIWVVQEGSSKVEVSNSPWWSRFIQTYYWALVLFAANFLLMLILRLRFDRGNKAEWRGQYYQELPAEVSPAVVSYLMDYKLKPRDILATLMDLTRRKYLELQIVQLDGGIFRRAKKDYVFRRMNSSAEGLQEHEQFLMEWLFSQFAENNEVSLANLRKMVKERYQADQFIRQFSDWKKMVIEAGEESGYFELSRAGVRIGVVVLLIQIVLFLYVLPEGYQYLLFSTLPLVFYGARKPRRTVLGMTERAKWQAWGRYVQDQGQSLFTSQDSEEILERYFSYAISLNIAKQVLAKLPLNLAAFDKELTSSLSKLLHDDLREEEFDNLVDLFNQGVDLAKSRSDTSDGGSSSAGGGGGGGGGGRGAF